ncbi:thiamine pyrophosphate-requiring protein [Ramlibacter sp. G-1-2-2]|uniref:Thiamine pyrophosphate-requiring protein n=1 Tax=Ramlibacter agri TaxID=2728837 RepID=A0A848H0C6_9BURK|nr:thiamine pyrophosphate-requiring protein [Ramlibacter agri]NML44265.1 thiamine pyrophosphate-requiring protein [Ramlibacter agri]
MRPTVAEAFLALLKERGVDRFYIGAGTDTAPLVEAYARSAESGLAFPQPVISTHENVAVGMAHGYYMVTGRPQAVMLHVSVGAANAVCGLFNAARAQVPILFTPGRTPVFEGGHEGSRDSEIQWSQEMFDQAGMLRELVKWDYELRDGSNVHQLVDRALAIAMAHPRGPVCLTLPREALAAPLPESAPWPLPAPAQVAPAGPAPDPAAVAQLARALASAEFPAILCTGSGADPSTVAALASLSERFGIAVGDARSRYTCFPSSHPLFLGHDHVVVLKRADALLFLEADVPWVPKKGEPVAKLVAHAGTDPLFTRYPLRGHRTDLAITTTIAQLLPALSSALEDCGALRDADARRARALAWAGELRSAARARADADTQRGGAISKSFLTAAVTATLPADALVVNEYPVARERMPFDEPGRYFVHPTSAGLGWGFPAALGAQQAAPDRTVVAMLGDGAYLFANPAACHHASQLHGLPVLVIVFDNGGWEAVQNAATLVYPQGTAAAQVRAGGSAPLSNLAPLPDFARYAEASGGAGFRVSERAELEDVLRRAFRVVREEKRQALVHVTGRG